MRRDDRPLIKALRVDSENPGHVQVTVFVGRQEGSLGHAGTLTFRKDEWDELGRVDSGGNLVVHFQVRRG